MSTHLILPVLDPDEKIGGGSYGDVFPDPNEPGRCIKRFRDPLDADASRQLIRLVDVLRWARPSDAETLTTRFAWPLEVFGDPDSLVGFSMPRLPDTARFELVSVRASTKDLQVKYLMDASFWQRPATRSRPPYVSSGDRLEIILDLAQALQVLHDNALCYGDISANNIAIDLVTPPRVFLFDADSILTVSERGRRPLVSPGWDSPHGLDPIEIDRSRFALFVVRIFSEELNATPASVNPRSLSEQVARLLPLLDELYTHGTADSFDEAREALRSLRSPDAARSAFDNAVQSEFARRVLAERIHATERSDQKLVELAENQIFYETAYTGMSGQGRRRGLQRDKLQRSGFKLDVPPSAVPAHAPRTEADLKNLIHLAMFEDIAHHHANNDLGPLTHHGWTGRAIEHAHVEIEPPELQIKTEPGSLTARAWWPPNPLVNIMRLRITGPGIDHTSDLARGQAGHQLERELKLPNGGDVTVTLHAGCSAAGNSVIWTPEPIQVTHTVHPIPQPPPDHPRATDSGFASMSEIINPAATREQAIIERLEHEIQQREQRAARRQRVATWIIALTSITLAGVLGYKYIYPGPPDPAAVIPATDAPAAQPAGFTIRVGPGYALADWDTLPATDDSVQYLLDWGDGTSNRTGRTQQIRTITEPVTIRPVVTTNGSNNPTTSQNAHAAITITEPGARPADAGLPRSAAIGIDHNGIFITLGPVPTAPPATLAVTITDGTGLNATRFQTNWQPDIRLPSIGPGTWTITIATSLQQAYPFPTITIDPDHPSNGPREDTTS